MLPMYRAIFDRSIETIHKLRRSNGRWFSWCNQRFCGPRYACIKSESEWQSVACIMANRLKHIFTNAQKSMSHLIKIDKSPTILLKIFLIIQIFLYLKYILMCRALLKYMNSLHKTSMISMQLSCIRDSCHFHKIPTLFNFQHVLSYALS